MRVSNWKPNAFDETFENVAIERLIEGAEVVASEARQKLRAHIGAGKTTGISRQPYKTGPYAGQEWTGRNFGALLKSIRVVRKKTKSGHAFSQKRNVRVYCGNYLAYYARIFEFYKPFMRPGFIQALPQVKAAIGATSENRDSKWGEVFNFKPDPARSAFLDSFEASLRK